MSFGDGPYPVVDIRSLSVAEALAELEAFEAQAAQLPAAPPLPEVPDPISAPADPPLWVCLHSLHEDLQHFQVGVVHTEDLSLRAWFMDRADDGLGVCPACDETRRVEAGVPIAVCPACGFAFIETRRVQAGEPIAVSPCGLAFAAAKRATAVQLREAHLVWHQCAGRSLVLVHR